MFASFVAKETAAAATDVNPWDPDFIRPTRVFDVMEEKPHKALRDFYDVGVDEAYKTSTIRIRRCNLISKHVTSLMQRATTRCPHLEVLELTSNFSLRGDNLGINDHGHEAYTRNGDGIDAIIDVVRTSRTLRKLGLRKNALDASAVANLAHALRANRHTVLHTLELGQNPWVHYHGCLTIAHMMVTNRSITSLDMSYCDVGNSAPEFASALLKNRAVATLSLRGNSIDSLQKSGGQVRKLQEVRVHELRYCQNNVGRCFQDGRRLDETVRKLHSGEVAAGDFPRLRVVSYMDLLWSLDNRRLRCLKEAFPERTHADTTVTVQLEPLTDKTIAREFQKKFTVGKTVEQRR